MFVADCENYVSDILKMPSYFHKGRRAFENAGRVLDFSFPQDTRFFEIVELTYSDLNARHREEMSYAAQLKLDKLRRRLKESKAITAQLEKRILNFRG